MSRGFGKMQPEILDYLEDRHEAMELSGILDWCEIGRLDPVEPDTRKANERWHRKKRSVHGSARRALRSLIEAGRVQFVVGGYTPESPGYARLTFRRTARVRRGIFMVLGARCRAPVPAAS